MEKIIVLKGIAVPYELQRKNIRRMNLRVHRDGRVLVSASRDTAQWEIEAFLLGNADFVLQIIQLRFFLLQLRLHLFNRFPLRFVAQKHPVVVLMELFHINTLVQQFRKRHRTE